MIQPKPRGSFFNQLIKIVTSSLCRIKKNNLDEIPHEGPLIVFTNHIGGLEIPLIYSHLQPRPITAMAKIESWDNGIVSWLFDLWKIIPVRRGEADVDAIRQSIEMIREGYIFAITPEGTRSRDGKLRHAHPGVVPLALHSGAPLLPMAHWGAENFPENIKKLRRTDFEIRLGNAFILDARGERVTSAVREEMVSEMMYQLAKLLPPKYRGYYADVENATEKYLRFL